MFSWIYSLILTIVGLAYLPKLLYDLVVYKKYRHSLKQRLGLGWPKLPSEPIIWLHAVSVGETRAIAALAAMLCQRHPNYPLIVSSVTETGHATAKQLLPQAQAHVFLPFDVNWIIYPLLRRLNIHLLIISENDLWPIFMTACKRRGARIALVNGKLSQRSLRRFQWCHCLSEKLVGLLDVCCVQNELYLDRFQQLGVPSERIHITGNLKFDVPATPSSQLPIRRQLGLADAAAPLLIVAGSTHSGEEEFILASLQNLWQTYPTLQLVLAPRHPERFDSIARWLEQSAIPFMRWSQGYTAPWRVALIDTIGQLPKLYALAQIAIVGGSFVPGVGGHNIVEPCLIGTPVIFGPYMQNQYEMVQHVLTYHAGQQVETKDQLAGTLQLWLSSHELLEELKADCKQLSLHIQGSTTKTYLQLERLLLAGG